MNDNPYTSPNSAPDERKTSRTCTIMFWLSCVLALGMFAIAANGGYQYWLYTSEARMKLPAHILASSICVAGSGFGMLLSAIKWRRQRIRPGAVSFVCSLLVFFIGPLVLPLLM